MKLCILVSAFCILASVGLSYDVGVDTIVSPIGTIDSGQTVVPRCAVHAYTASGPVDVHFLVLSGGSTVYHDSVTLPPLPPGLVDTVQFAGWMPDGRDSMTAIAWTECAGDTFPVNDTFRFRFFVRVRDYAITRFFWQPDTLDSGVPVLFKAIVWSFGNTLDSGYARFRVGTQFVSTSDTVYPLGGLIPARDSWFPLPGFHVVSCSLFILPEDTCVAWIADTLYVHGSVFRDVAVESLWRDTSGTFRAVVANHGSEVATLWTWFKLRDSTLHTLFADSTQAIAGPGERCEVEMQSFQVNPGLYVVACSVWTPGDQDSTNNVKYLWFRVPPGALAEESRQLTACSLPPTATVVRGVLVLRASSVERDASGVLLDIEGRRVLALRPGANDVSGLGPGVFFIREHPIVSNQYSGQASVTKVVIQR